MSADVHRGAMGHQVPCSSLPGPVPPPMRMRWPASKSARKVDSVMASGRVDARDTGVATGPDAQEGVVAMVEKRKPKFQK